MHMHDRCDREGLFITPFIPAVQSITSSGSLGIRPPCCEIPGDTDKAEKSRPMSLFVQAQLV